ncbi:MAG TPA: flavodoxin-dependent (E)-4-hydroxy-3-methylbut-2-enyl-diphosphate synthase [Actinobacteria bacterium]|nr:flavodoxin-dependent (E)-4-hydroxy-3-methylbut-2-enyl-diphosphate synthase [Actinomycetes bacterium]HEX21104.1 flavodoxin-dependent (E)-4-hydroxy-3-methylbut-2-enyl-diphosphate synthase [Actinomycetota bacterium]
MSKKLTKQVMVGNVAIGGGAPIAIQSMTNTKTINIAATLQQIHRLEAAGCEIIRISLPDEPSVKAFKQLKKEAQAPLVADIHFRWELAVAAIKAGADKVRINPGNIKDKDGIKKIVATAGLHNIPLRIGVNAGSLSDIIRDSDLANAEKLVVSALESVALIESMGFTDLVISAKTFSVPEALTVYRTLAAKLDYPLHIGITESGTKKSGSLRSAVGLGILLSESIGDTLRVSLSADPVEEVYVAQQILQILELRRFHPELVSCPTCARCDIDLIPIANELEERLSASRAPLRVAVMGCVVNGPGEARQSDIGIAAGKGRGVLFKDGRIIKNVAEENFVDELMKLVQKEKPE